MTTCSTQLAAPPRTPGTAQGQAGPACPDCGNSFWACRLEGRWYVGTWTPHSYRFADESKLADFCEAFVDVGTSAQDVVPPELVDRFGLIEVDPDEFDRLHAAVAPPE